MRSGTVHVFISKGRFRSEEELNAFIDPEYTESGDMTPSPLMREAGLSDFEPMCIESMREKTPIPLARLLEGVSYGDQWIPRVDGTREADAAICVYSPNRLKTPERCSMEYLGRFEYKG